MLEPIRDLLAKLPIYPLLLIFCGYLAYDYYEFENSPTSPVQQKLEEIKFQEQAAAKHKQTLIEIAKFEQNLAAVKLEIQTAMQKLEGFKSTIPPVIDEAEFTRTTTTEARRIGLTVTSIKPLEPIRRDLYSEKPFDFQIRGAFVQIVYFLDNLASLSKVVRVDDFEITPVGPVTARIVELQATLQLKAFMYQETEADKKGGTAAPAGASGAAAAAPATAPAKPAKTGGDS